MSRRPPILLVFDIIADFGTQELEILLKALTPCRSLRWPTILWFHAFVSKLYYYFCNILSKLPYLGSDHIQYSRQETRASTSCFRGLPSTRLCLFVFHHLCHHLYINICISTLVYHHLCINIGIPQLVCHQSYSTIGVSLINYKRTNITRKQAAGFRALAAFIREGNIHHIRVI